MGILRMKVTRFGAGGIEWENANCPSQVGCETGNGHPQACTRGQASNEQTRGWQCSLVWLVFLPQAEG